MITEDYSKFQTSEILIENVYCSINPSTPDPTKWSYLP